MCRVTFEFKANLRAGRKFVAGDEHGKFPRWVCLELTDTCNFRCGYCLVRGKHHGQKDLSLNEIDMLLTRLSENGVKQVSIIGGEPLLSPKLLPAVRMAHRLGLLIHLCTNGSLLDHQMAKMLKDAGVDQVQINVDHPSQTLHRSIRQIPQEYGVSANSALDHLRDVGVETVLATVLAPRNKTTIPRLYKMAYDSGYSAYRLWKRVRPSASTSLRRLDHMEFLRVVQQITLDEQLPRALRVLATSSELPEDMAGATEYARCPAGDISMCISCEGEVYPCAFHRKPVGNVRINDLGDLAEELMKMKTTDKRDLCNF